MSIFFLPDFNFLSVPHKQPVTGCVLVSFWRFLPSWHSHSGAAQEKKKWKSECWRTRGQHPKIGLNPGCVAESHLQVFNVHTQGSPLLHPDVLGLWGLPPLWCRLLRWRLANLIWIPCNFKVRSDFDGWQMENYLQMWTILAWFCNHQGCMFSPKWEDLEAQIICMIWFNIITCASLLARSQI